MKNSSAEIDVFLKACDDMMSGKFILADSKIGEILKAVAASEELTGLFRAVTEGFDFVEAKQRYLKFPAEPHSSRGAAYLPSGRKELLAFVFCLLAEFDSGRVRFNDFLLRYFYVDGSYTASYTVFTERLIRPFRDIVRDCYPEPGAGNADSLLRREDELIAALGEKVSYERSRIKTLSMSGDDAFAGEMILAELYAAVARRDIAEIKALLCGYLYYLSAVGGADANSSEIFRLAGELA